MLHIAAPLFVAVLLGACASEPDVKTSGFLANYSRLKPGGEGEPILYYAKPGLDLSKYPKIEIEPVMIRASSEDALKSVPMEELQRLVTLFYNSVKEEIGTVRQIVTTAGPSTMRLRLAITEIVGSDVSDDVISVIHPVGIVTNVGSVMATGTRAFAGRVSIEGVLTDSSSGQVLVEFVDQHVSSEKFKTGEWNQVESAFRSWAVAMRAKCVELSSGGAAEK